MTGWHKNERSLVELFSFLFDRLDDDEAAAQAMRATPEERGRPLRELAAKRSMVAMWFDGVQAELGFPSVAGLNVADAMIIALVTVYADHPLFDPGWLAAADQPDPPADDVPDNVVELRPGRP